MSKPKTSNDPTVQLRHGRIVVLSAPSGGGKSTLAQKVVAATSGIVRSVTYTTRPKRPGEINGCDYHFISQEEFLVRRQAGRDPRIRHGAWLSVWHVTPRCSAASAQQGLDVLLVIDYQGAAALRRQGVDALYIFILPPSLAALEQRLRQRNSDDESGDAYPTVRRPR